MTYEQVSKILGWRSDDFGHDCHELLVAQAMALTHVGEAYLLAIQEIECLRSVLSEWDQDKSCYLQWSRANDLADSRRGV